MNMSQGLSGHEPVCEQEVACGYVQALQVEDAGHAATNVKVSSAAAR